MWLYIPTSRSVQASAALILPSETHCQALAASCTLSGTSRQPQSWLRAWKTKPWMPRLFGAISALSTPDAGVDAWLASSAAYPVNPGPPPANGQGETTNGTSGPTRSASSGTYSPPGSSSKTWAEQFGNSEKELSGPTLKALATGLRRASSRRRKSAHPTDGNGSSSSQWPTAQAHDATGQPGRGSTERGGHQGDLPRIAENWPTPDTAPEAPNANSHKWASRNEPDFSPPGLGNAVKAWATPRTSDEALQTSNMERKGQLREQATRWNGRQAPRTPMPGLESSPSAQTSHPLRLNPKFVLWLMGLPETHLDM